MKGEAGETRPSVRVPEERWVPHFMSSILLSWDVIQAQATLPCQLLQQLDNMHSDYYFYFLIEVTDLKVHVLLVFLLGEFICPRKAFDDQGHFYFSYIMSQSTRTMHWSPHFQSANSWSSRCRLRCSLGDGALLIKPSFSYKRHEWVNLGKGITSLILSTPRMHCK